MTQTPITTSAYYLAQAKDCMRLALRQKTSRGYEYWDEQCWTHLLLMEEQKDLGNCDAARCGGGSR